VVVSDGQRTAYPDAKELLITADGGVATVIGSAYGNMNFRVLPTKPGLMFRSAIFRRGQMEQN